MKRWLLVGASLPVATALYLTPAPVWVYILALAFQLWCFLMMISHDIHDERIAEINASYTKEKAEIDASYAKRKADIDASYAKDAESDVA